MGPAARRLLHPELNPAGLMSAAGAIYAVVTMVFNAYNHGGIISTPVIVAAITAVSALLTRQVVTPLADPVDGAGRQLVPVPPPAAAMAASPPAGGARTAPQHARGPGAGPEEPLRRYESGPSGEQSP